MINNDWRSNIKVGDIIDGIDQHDTWYLVTVIDRRDVMIDSTNTTNVKVGYRIYIPSGNKIDEIGKFEGFSSAYDEWINLYSLRLQPKGLMSKKGEVDNKKADEDFMNKVEDSYDILRHKYDSNIIYAISRPPLYGKKLYCNIINEFGKSGAFAKVLNRMRDTKHILDFDLFYYYCDIIGNMSECLHKQFAEKFIDEYYKASTDYMLKAPEAEIRNMKKERLENIVKGFSRLLLRIYTSKTKGKMIDEFQMQMYEICLKSEYLERKLQGLKGICDYCRFMKLQRNDFNLVQWLESQKILDYIFYHGAHPQMVQRSGEIIKYLIFEHSMKEENLSKMWEVANDEQLSVELFKMLSDIAVYFTSLEGNFLLNKMGELKVMSEEAVDLISDIAKTAMKNSDYIIKACNKLWNIFSSTSNSKLFDKAIGKFADVINIIEMPNVKQEYIVQCIDKIKSGQLLGYIILRKILSQMGGVAVTNKTEIIDTLIKSNQMLDVVFQDLIALTKQPHESVAIVERVEFLQYLLENGNIKLNEEYLCNLWQMLINQSPQEKAVLFKFMEELFKGVPNKYAEIDSVKRLFEQKICNITESCASATLDYFWCVKNSFLLVNEKMKGIQRLIITQSSNQIFNFVKKAVEEDFKIMIHPDKLLGVGIFWKLILECNEISVVARSIDFLNKVYSKLSEELLPQLLDIRTDYIKAVLDKIDSATKEVPNVRDFQLKKLLYITKDMIEISEIKGTGGLKAHNALLKGDIINISVFNSISTTKKCPKKINFTFYSSITIWDMKKEIGKYIECTPESMKLCMDGNDLKEIDNGKSLSEMKIKGKALIVISQKSFDDIPRVPLVVGTELSQRGIAAFTEVFSRFSTNGLMNPEGCVEFIKACTNDSCRVDDHRVKEFFKLHDDDKDGFITCNGFLEFYRRAAVDKDYLVWANLASLGYRNDLKKINEIEETVVNLKELPRYILSKEPKSFELYFKMLDYDVEVAILSWTIINKLATNPHIYENVMKIDAKVDWPSFFYTSSNYKMLYVIQIMESMLEQSDENVEAKKEWKRAFVVNGGLQYLINAIIPSETPENRFSKQAVRLALKLVSVFLVATLWKNDATAVKNVEPPKEEVKQTAPTENKEDEVLVVTLANGRSDTKKISELSDELRSLNIIPYLTSILNDNSLLLKLLTLLSNIVLKEEIKYDDGMITTNCINIIEQMVINDKEKYKILLDYKSTEYKINFSDLIIKFLLCPKSYIIREQFANFMGIFIKSCDNSVPIFTYNLLHEYLYTVIKDKISECKEFFLTLKNSIEALYITKTINVEQIFTEFITILKNHLSSEKIDSVCEDKMLVGILDILTTLLKLNPELGNIASQNKLLEELFSVCLFPHIVSEEKKDIQKCKVKESRAAAYRLLNLLCSYKKECMGTLLQECILSLTDAIKVHNTWCFSPSGEGRSIFGYAGIENLGCICYMISMLQQFYIVPCFRYSIMGADDKKLPNINAQNNIDDNVLHMLQSLFWHLELSERKSISPYRFCFAFKDQDGHPTNIAVQQDAQEFINMLFERLENSLKNTEDKYVPISVFGGRTCSQITCQGCNTMKKNYEDIFELPASVKWKTLKESLQNFIQGETISDYMCDICKKKVNVVKRTCLSQLPNMLIVHLQRMVFNYDTFQNEKVNSRLEFPNTLNLYPYTVEGLEEIEKKDNTEASVAKHHPYYYEYKLVGVVVHYGTADAGHYYSYINPKRDGDFNDPAFMKTENERWLEFNDSTVKLFDFKKLESECFGGTQENSDELSWYARSMENIKSAYMLIYERRLKTHIKFLIEPLSIPSAQEINLKSIKDLQLFLEEKHSDIIYIYDEDKKEHQKLLPFSKSTLPSLPQLANEVNKDNSLFLFEKQIFSNEFYQFISDILLSCSNITFSPESVLLRDKFLSSIIRIGHKMIFEILARAAYNAPVKLMTDLYVKIITFDYASCAMFIDFEKSDNNFSSLFNILLNCPDKEVRICAQKIMVEVLNKLLTYERSILDEPGTQNDDKTYFHKFVKEYVCMLTVGNVSQSWVRFDQFFGIIRDLTVNHQCIQYFIKREYISILADFYLGSQSPLAHEGDKKHTMGNRIMTPNFSPLIETLCCLASHQLNKRIEFNDKDKLVLLNKELISKTLKGSHSVEQFSKLVCDLSLENYKYSKKVAKCLLTGINECDLNESKSFFYLTKKFLSIKDTIQHSRIEWLLGFDRLTSPVKSDQSEENQFGLDIVKNVSDEVYGYYSSLLSYKKDCILLLIYRTRKRMESYICSCLSYLLNLAIEDSTVYNYISALPPMTYQHLRYTDWIGEFLEEYASECIRLSKASVYYKEREELAVSTQQLYIKFASMLNDKLVPPQYLVGKCYSNKVIFTLNAENINATITQLNCEVLPSKPNKKGNDGITKEWANIIDSRNVHKSEEYDEKGNKKVAFMQYGGYDNSSDDSNEAIAGYDEDEMREEGKNANTNYKTPVEKKNYTAKSLKHDLLSGFDKRMQHLDEFTKVVKEAQLKKSLEKELEDIPKVPKPEVNEEMKNEQPKKPIETHETTQITAPKEKGPEVIIPCIYKVELTNYNSHPMKVLVKLESKSTNIKLLKDFLELIVENGKKITAFVIQKITPNNDEEEIKLSMICTKSKKKVMTSNQVQNSSPNEKCPTCDKPMSQVGNDTYKCRYCEDVTSGGYGIDEKGNYHYY